MLTAYSLSNLVICLVLWADLGSSPVLFAICVALLGKVLYYDGKYPAWGERRYILDHCLLIQGISDFSDATW